LRLLNPATAAIYLAAPPHRKQAALAKTSQILKIPTTPPYATGRFRKQSAILPTSTKWYPVQKTVARAHPAMFIYRPLKNSVRSKETA
jgi:hypothetical protein